jgi:hypothetical protein
VLAVDDLARVPGDLEVHDGDGEADQRIGDSRVECDDDRAGYDAERDEAVPAR